MIERDALHPVRREVPSTDTTASTTDSGTQQSADASAYGPAQTGEEPEEGPLELEESWRTADAETPPSSAPRHLELQQDSGAPPAVPPSDRADAAADAEPGQSMSLLEHLGELRTRLTRALIAAAVGFLLCYSVAEVLFNYLTLPLIRVMPADAKLIYLGVAEAFFVELKVAFVAGVFLASPYIFHQIWAFIAPGLYDEEKRHVIPLALCSALFFLGGAAFCYFVVFPFAFTFFMSYSTENIVAMPSMNEYFSFTLKLLLAFGLIFEMPLFSLFLSRMGLVTAARMRAVRKYAVLGIFVAAAILTPPDVFSQLLMAVPMLALYEISILVAAATGRRKPRQNSAPGAVA